MFAATVCFLPGCSESAAEKRSACRADKQAQQLRVRYQRPAGSQQAFEPDDVLRDRVETRLKANPAIRFDGDCPATVTVNAGYIEVFAPKGSPDLRPVLKRQSVLEFRTVFGEWGRNEIPPQVGPDQVVLKGSEGTYLLGPSLLPTSPVATAKSELNPQSGSFEVEATLTPQGSEDFDAMAVANFDRQIAIVVDAKVISAPTINAMRFGGSFQISGNLTEAETKSLAQAISGGAFPAQLEIFKIEGP